MPHNTPHKSGKVKNNSMATQREKQHQQQSKGNKKVYLLKHFLLNCFVTNIQLLTVCGEGFFRFLMLTFQVITIMQI
jgi:hypothetical protein